MLPTRPSAMARPPDRLSGSQRESPKSTHGLPTSLLTSPSSAGRNRNRAIVAQASRRCNRWHLLWQYAAFQDFRGPQTLLQSSGTAHHLVCRASRHSLAVQRISPLRTPPPVPRPPARQAARSYGPNNRTSVTTDRIIVDTGL